MGKFDGVLFMTDYDDTYCNQQFRVSPENRAAARYFMDQGGFFSFATGRARRTFTPQIAAQGLIFNAPVVLTNGGSAYDYGRGEYLYRTCLAPEVHALVEELCRVFPELAVEAYHNDDIYIYNHNQVSRAHMERVGGPYTVCPTLAELPTPWEKLILEQDGPYLERVQAYINANRTDRCEAVFSNRYLLELTDPAANKGSMVVRVAEHLKVDPRHIYCMGDNQNDLPMLERSAIPFAPANCVQELKDWGVHVLGHCDDHAVAQAIALLDSIY